MQRFDDAKLLDGFVHSRPAPNARRINQFVRFSVALERHDDAIPCCPRLIVDNKAFFAEQPVDECGLAYVWAADHGDAQAPLIARTGDVCLVINNKRLEHRIHKRCNAIAVRGRDRNRLAQPETVKLGRGDVRIEAFGFVRNQPNSGAGAARQLSHVLIGRRKAGPPINHYDSGVRLVQRQHALFDHTFFDTHLAAGDAARIHDEVGARPEFAVTVLSISG